LQDDRPDLLGSHLLKIVEQNERLATVSDPESVAETVCGCVQSMVEADSVALYLVRGESLRLLGRLGGDMEGGSVDVLLDQCNETVLQALRRKEIVLDADPAREDPRGSGGQGSLSQMAVPLHLAGEVEGVLDLRSRKRDAFGEPVRTLLTVAANCIASALRHTRIREELEAERERLETLIGSSADAIITTDEAGDITLFSPGAEEIFGYEASEILGAPVSQYYYRGVQEARRVMKQLREKGKIQNYETWFRSKSGRGVPASLSSSLLYDSRGNVTGTLGVLKDITRQKEMEEKLNYTIERLQVANEQLEVLAVTDNLSGLYNHRYFYRELEAEMERCMRTRRPMSVLMVDIDAFKKFNDTYGHQIGDQIIEEIGQVIRGSIRRVDTGCRYGGEEFTVILPETRSEQARIVAERIRLGFGGSPLFGNLQIEPTTLSIGVVMYNPRGGRIQASEIVRSADGAMYRAKREGGDSVYIGETLPPNEERPDAGQDDVLG